jgi:hypothetical protein
MVECAIYMIVCCAAIPLYLLAIPPFVLLFSRPNMVIKLLLQLLHHCS